MCVIYYKIFIRFYIRGAYIITIAIGTIRPSLKSHFTQHRGDDFREISQRDKFVLNAHARASII